MIGREATANHVFEGSDAAARLFPGAGTTVLSHVVRRFHYEVMTLKTGQIEGFRTSREVAAPLVSNYLSGTAVAPDFLPPGSAGNLFSNQVFVIRDILADCEGTVRWGGDDSVLPIEGHFQLDVSPKSADLARVAAKISGWQARPGRGAGGPSDPDNPDRRAAAAALQRRQSQ